MLTVIETHPVQYHAPVYRALQRSGVPVTAIYGSDFSVVGYRDREFGARFAWDSDLLTGYRSMFLSRVASGGAASAEQVSARGLGRALRAAQPSVVLLTGYSPRFHQVALWQACRSGRPILFRAETTDRATRRHAPKAWARDLALRWLYRRCARVLYVGHYSRQHFQRLGCSPQQLVASPYSVDTTPFAPDEVSRTTLRAATRDALGIASDQTAILFSGKLSARKGPDLLLRAVKQLPSLTRSGSMVLFLGSGDERGALEALAKEPPAVRVAFLGFQNQSQLSRYYHAADLLALPSRHSETWGLVVNEALHHGLPCVISQAVGCGPDLVEPGVTGEWCQTESASSLAAALERGLALVGRTEIRERCRLKVGAHSQERAAEGIAAAYWAVVP